VLVGIGWLLRLEDDGGGQQNSDQAKADKREKSNHEDRHKILLWKNCATATSGAR
jgi:hypothetical protein